MPPKEIAETIRVDPTVAHQLREVDPCSSRDLASIALLHTELLDFGPLTRLGELFIREICYGVNLKAGQMKAALYEVDERSVGFISYTPRSIDFHRESVERRWGYMAWILGISMLQDPRRMFYLPTVMRILFSRRGERAQGGEPLGEILTIGVHRLPKFFRQTAVRIADELMNHAFAYFQEAGIYRVRGIVDADNKPSLRLCARLGGSFEPYEQAGRPVVQVWFDLKNRELGVL